ncbi:MAG: Maf family protein [Deltaproteobacteria bacterium]|nr:Maf family protein [Deltaproteobacteria bacterium]
MIVLASRSVVRVKLMRDAGVTFEADAADLDEDALVEGISDPAVQAVTLARAKGLHVAKRYPGRFVVGGDQVGVNDDDSTLLKPLDPEHHVTLLMSMSGRTHRFFPAAALVKDASVIASVVDDVAVTFWNFSESVARQYVATGEGVGSCGGYESENRGAQLIERVQGSLQAVLGFPLLLVLPMLRKHCALEAGLLR